VSISFRGCDWRPGGEPGRSAVGGARARGGAVLSAAALLMLGGCAVGPDFFAPAAPAVEGYEPGKEATKTASGPGTAAQAFRMGRDVPGQWWRLFHSRALDKLIDEALVANPSAEAAQATLWQARENLYAQAGIEFPSIDGKASATRQQFNASEFGQGGAPIIFNLFQASVNVSYTLDIWGAGWRQIEASQAQAEYQRFELEATYLTLTANVATAVIQAASLQGQIDVTQDIIKAESDQLDVMRKQFDLGGIAKTDVLQQETEVAQTQATLPPLQKQLSQQRHLIAALIGRFPSEARGATPTLETLRLPADLPVSLPSRLVEQRPDVRAAEAQLHQASAQIGVAVANRLPQITLTGSYGNAALTLGSLFSPASVVWNATAGATQPIFHGFTLLHQQRAAEAGYDAAFGTYKNVVLTSFQNVADALRALRSDADAAKAQQTAVDAASLSLDLTRNQYQLGAITYVNLLNAQRSYQQALLSLVQARAARFADTVALFQALGGGWWNRIDVIPDPLSPEGPTIEEAIATLSPVKRAQSSHP
jgi:NodT family efflux transporter outer membrane factor (OMF) lipoprotein